MDLSLLGKPAYIIQNGLKNVSNAKRRETAQSESHLIPKFLFGKIPGSFSYNDISLDIGLQMSI